MNNSVPPYRAGGTAMKGGPMSPMCMSTTVVQERLRGRRDTLEEYCLQHV